MFDYLNNGFNIITIIFIVLLALSLEKWSDIKNEQTLIGMIIILILINLYSAYSSQIDAKKNIILFKNGVEFTCKPDLSRSTLKLKGDSDDFRVSLKNGWGADEDYFVKNPFLIRADKCTLVKN